MSKFERRVTISFIKDKLSLGDAQLTDKGDKQIDKQTMKGNKQIDKETMEGNKQIDKQTMKAHT